MIKFTSLVIIPFVTFQLFSVVNDFNKELPQPVQIKEPHGLTQTKKALKLLGRDLKYAEPLYISASANGIDPVLWTANIETESMYKITAVSPKKYKGLGQTPSAMMKTGYEQADLMYAACILKEKTKYPYSNGNMFKALTLYKGGTSKEAVNCAQKTYNLYSKLKQQINEQEKLENDTRLKG